jgi:hypothetical protein
LYVSEAKVEARAEAQKDAQAAAQAVAQPTAQAATTDRQRNKAILQSSILSLQSAKLSNDDALHSNVPLNSLLPSP